jgi:hypothetical protein
MIRVAAKAYLHGMIDLIGTTAVENWTTVEADTMREAVNTLSDLSLEDLKEEAAKHDLILSKKPPKVGRLKKHCGRIPWRSQSLVNVKLGDGTFGRAAFVKCEKCGKKVCKIYKGATKAEILADIGKAWNEMVEKENEDA